MCMYGISYIKDITWTCRDTTFSPKCWTVFSKLGENFPIPKQPCNILLIYYKNTNKIPHCMYLTLQYIAFCLRWDLLCNHGNSNLFMHAGNMSFSHVKISCFAQLVFLLCLLIIIINLYITFYSFFKSC